MACNDKADIQALSASWSDRPLLLLGPGKNLELEKEAILSYIKAHNPITISVNFIPEGIPIDYAFLSNSRRYVQLNNRLLEHADAQGRPVRVIATSNVTNVKDTHFDYTLNYNSLIDQNAEIIDNSFVMLLNVLTKTSVHHAACAGFDGYTVDGDNYYNSAMDYRIAREKSQSINQYVIDTLERLAGTLTLEFLTDSKYVK